MIDVLHGMIDGTIAGILGTRRTEATRWLFKEVNDLGPSETVMRRRLRLGEDARWLDLERVGDNSDQFRFLHAAFRLDYRNWLNRG